MPVKQGKGMIGWTGEVMALLWWMLNVVFGMTFFAQSNSVLNSEAQIFILRKWNNMMRNEISAFVIITNLTTEVVSCEYCPPPLFVFKAVSFSLVFWRDATFPVVVIFTHTFAFPGFAYLFFGFKRMMATKTISISCLSKCHFC